MFSQALGTMDQWTDLTAVLRLSVPRAGLRHLEGTTKEASAILMSKYLHEEKSSSWDISGSFY